MIDVFLSAGVPSHAQPEYSATADIVAIREAVKALVEVVLPVGRITCGGHPAITPLLALFVREAGLDSDRLTIFQSQLFAFEFPAELREFADVRLVDAIGDDRDASLSAMRNEMLASRDFGAGVFIGGMKGVADEAELFAQRFARAMLLPVATTGGAAAEVYRRHPLSGAGLDKEFSYFTLFRRRLRAPR